MSILNRKRKSPVNGLFIAGIGAGLAIGLSALRRASRRINFKGRVAVITGGSRGLGLQMARQLAREGANLAILARNEPELEAAYQELIDSGADVLVIPCDVSDQQQVKAAIDEVMEQYGRLDVLINNAGVIQVGPLDHMQIEDFKNAMDTHFWGPLYTMYEVIPIMRRQGGGRIVNVTSIAGKVAVPHLAPYVASKFAAAGLSDAFRHELAKDGIDVSTIVPGLMRTGSYYHGNFKGDNDREFRWFTLLDTTPVTAMSDRRAARQIISAARYGIPKRTLTVQARMLEIIEELAPNLTAWVMKQANNRILPEPAGDQGNELRTGFESRSKAAPSWITKMGDRAAERNNEMIAEKIR